MNSLFLVIFPLFITGLAFVTYKHPLRMRRLLYIATGILFGFTGAIFIYHASTSTAYENVRDAMQRAQDFDKTNKGSDELFEIASSNIISLEMGSLSTSQNILFYSTCALCVFIIFLLLTYLFVYLQRPDYKKRK